MRKPHMPADPAKSLRRSRKGDRERFAQELIAGNSLYAAYRLAGFGGDGDVRGNAQKLEADPEIQARIDYLRARLEVYEATALALRRIKMRRWLENVVEIDRLEMFERPGLLKDELSAEQRALIEGVEVTKWGIKYLMPKKLEAQAQLARLDGLDKPLKIAETTVDGKELPSTADRARALAAFIAETQAEMAAMDAAKENAA